jgi:hypothetical protein
MRHEVRKKTKFSFRAAVALAVGREVSREDGSHHGGKSVEQQG